MMVDGGSWIVKNSGSLIVNDYNLVFDIRYTINDKRYRSSK